MSAPDGARSLPRRIHELALAHPGRVAITEVAPDGAERALTWAELAAGASRIARLLAEHGVSADDVVAVAYPNGVHHVLTVIAIHALGATALPLSPGLPPPSRDPILATARARLLLTDRGDSPIASLSRADLDAADALPDAPLPDRAGRRAGTSGGSTGRPKVIVDPRPWSFVPGDLVRWMGGGMRAGQRQLVATPMYHGVPFRRTHFGLFEDHTLVLMERFDAARWVDVVERHRIELTFVVPTMMVRILRDAGVRSRDLSSLEAVVHSAAPAADWLKRAWIDLVGPTRLYETYGASDMAAGTTIRGDEWLAHPGSVGRGDGVDIRIQGEDGHELPIGEVGEVYLRDHARPGAPFTYIGGAPPPTTPDGFVSAGDLGRVDADGYLYLADRRVDLIITGGANVYAAEVEAVLSAHPRVADVAVIGLPDPEWGKRVHALVQPADRRDPPPPATLDAFCRERLPAYKCPKSYEIVEALPRSDAGKIQRSALVAERA